MTYLRAHRSKPSAHPCASARQSYHAIVDSAQRSARMYGLLSVMNFIPYLIAGVPLRVEMSLARRIARITDPRSLAEPYPRLESPRDVVASAPLLEPPASPEEARRAELVTGPNIRSLPKFDPLPDTLDLPILLKRGDDVSTDEIMPAGRRCCPIAPTFRRSTTSPSSA